MTEPAATSADLQHQHETLTAEHEAAIHEQDIARKAAQIAEGRHELGQLDDATLESATEALDSASRRVSRKQAAMEAITADIEEAQEREREGRRATLSTETESLDRRWTREVRGLTKDCEALRARFTALDDINADRAGIRSAIVELRDLPAEEEALRQRYARRYEELKRTTPPGMEIDEASLDFRYDRDLEQLRAAAHAEAAALAPDADVEALAEVVDAYSDLVPRLVDSATRTALARGAEFLAAPLARGASGSGLGGQTSMRIYGTAELDEARNRYDAIQATIARLAGRTTSLADERRTPGRDDRRVAA